MTFRLILSSFCVLVFVIWLVLLRDRAPGVPDPSGYSGAEDLSDGAQIKPAATSGERAQEEAARSSEPAALETDPLLQLTFQGSWPPDGNARSFDDFDFSALKAEAASRTSNELLSILEALGPSDPRYKVALVALAYCKNLAPEALELLEEIARSASSGVQAERKRQIWAAVFTLAMRGAAPQLTTAAQHMLIEFTDHGGNQQLLAFTLLHLKGPGIASLRQELDPLLEMNEPFLTSAAWVALVHGDSRDRSDVLQAALASNGHAREALEHVTEEHMVPALLGLVTAPPDGAYARALALSAFMGLAQMPGEQARSALMPLVNDPDLEWLVLKALEAASFRHVPSGLQVLTAAAGTSLDAAAKRSIRSAIDQLRRGLVPHREMEEVCLTIRDQLPTYAQEGSSLGLALLALVHFDASDPGVLTWLHRLQPEELREVEAVLSRSAALK